MALLEQAICTIEKINNKGLGVGKTEQGIVELPYVLPGDMAEFERHGYRGQTNTILKNIVQEHHPRREPACKYFGACGGCLLQHFPEEEYAHFKFRLIQNALADNHIETLVKPLVYIPFGQRRRANLEAVKKNGQVFLGFHRLFSHQIINLDSCPALMPELSQLIAPFKLLLEAVMEDRQKLGMFVTRSAAGIDISLEIQNLKSLNDSQRTLLQHFAQEHDLARLLFRYRKTLDVIYEKSTPYVEFDGVRVEIDSYCFLQSSDLSDSILKDIVIKYLTPERDDYIVDLFCGRGTYTIPLSKYAKIDGFESDAKALQAHSKAAAVHDLPVSLIQRDLFTSPLMASDLSRYTKCIINPPRAGAESQSKELAKSKISNICYVSCNPETFARDAKILIGGGYKLLEVTPLDQFYFSPHLEVVGWFSLG